MSSIDINKIKKVSLKLNILFISSSKDENSTEIQYLNNFFNNIILFSDTIEALQYFKNNEVDIILTDIENTSLCSFEMIEEMKTLNKKLISIIYTDNDKPEYLIRSINLGVDGYLLSPMNQTDFLNILLKSLKKLKLKNKNKKIKKNLKLLKQYHEVVDKNSIVSKIDNEGIITYVNNNFCLISEYTNDELIGQHYSIVNHPNQSKKVHENLWKTIKDEKKEWSGVIKNRTKSGKPYYVKTTMKPILSSKGEVVEYINVKSNITTIQSDKKNLMSEIEDNNISLLLLVQIEEFDMIDKFYNIDIVNKIESVFAERLLDYLPSEYIFENIYNIGNGQFALLTDFFTFSKSELNLNNYINNFIQEVKESILVIDDIEYDLNIIVSYSFGKMHLFEDAKCGLDEAIQKKEMINFANDYSIKEHIEAKKNIEVMKMVKIALDNYKIVSYFQPIINNKTKETEKYESLVRLVDEKGVVLSPSQFLDISKKGSYYNKITHRVLENSFKILEQINTKLSINLSSVDIEKEETRRILYELLESHKDDAHRIVFELLEDEEVKNFNVIRRFIKKVKKMGVKIAIDDFGTGYSNFERLLKFEPDILKIDGSLVRNIVNDDFSKNIIETIVMFAKKQNIETVAEYVENEEIFNILNDLGVDYSQGYYFGKPENINLLNI